MILQAGDRISFNRHYQVFGVLVGCKFQADSGQPMPWFFPPRLNKYIRNTLQNQSLTLWTTRKKSRLIISITLNSQSIASLNRGIQECEWKIDFTQQLITSSLTDFPCWVQWPRWFWYALVQWSRPGLGSWK